MTTDELREKLRELRGIAERLMGERDRKSAWFCYYQGQMVAYERALVELSRLELAESKDPA